MKVPLFHRPYTIAEQDAAAHVLIHDNMTDDVARATAALRQHWQLSNDWYIVLTDSCSRALWAACIAAGWKKLPIKVPALTFAATANAVLLAGNEVYFGDVDSESHCMADADELSLPVAFGGNVGAIGKVNDWAHMGCKPPETQPGFYCYSFHPTKPLGALGGGAVVWHRSLAPYNLVRNLLDQGRTPGKHYSVAVPGTKGLMTNIQAAVLRASLPNAHTKLVERQSIARGYDQALCNQPGFTIMRHEKGSSLHLYIIRGNTVEDTVAIQNRLIMAGVEYGLHYPSLSRQAAYGGGYTPVADHLASVSITLPLWAGMTLDMQNQVISAVLG